MSYVFQVFVVLLEVSMIFFACARPQNSSILQFDTDLSQMKENQQQLEKGPTRLRRSTWHPCYKTDNNGNPITTLTTNGTVIYDCRGWTTPACSHVDPIYHYAKCDPVLSVSGNISIVVGCDCASI